MENWARMRSRQGIIRETERLNSSSVLVRKPIPNTDLQNNLLRQTRHESVWAHTHFRVKRLRFTGDFQSRVGSKGVDGVKPFARPMNFDLRDSIIGFDSGAFARLFISCGSFS